MTFYKCILGNITKSGYNTNVNTINFWRFSSTVAKARYPSFVYIRDAVNTYEGAKNIQPIKKEWMYDDIDLIGLVETSGTPIFVQYVKEIIANNGIKKFISLDVWSEEFSKDLGILDPRPLGWKMIHTYLRLSRKYSNTIVIRGIDYVLKKIV